MVFVLLLPHGGRIPLLFWGLRLLPSGNVRLDLPKDAAEHGRQWQWWCLLGSRAGYLDSAAVLLVRVFVFCVIGVFGGVWRGVVTYRVASCGVLVRGGRVTACLLFFCLAFVRARSPECEITRGSIVGKERECLSNE